MMEFIWFRAVKNAQRQQDILRNTPFYTFKHCMFTVCIFLPSREGGDEEGGLVGLAGGYVMCGRGLRWVRTGWRDCEVMEGESHIKTTHEGKYLHQMRHYRGQ